MKKSIRAGEGIAEFFGTHDSNVKYLESLLNVQVHLQDETLTIDGPDEKVALVERLISDYLQLRSEGVRFSNGDLKSIIRIISEDQNQSLRGVMTAYRSLVVGKRALTPKTLNQKLYLDSIETNDMVFGIGPAGTGKTYLAVSMAVRALVDKRVNRIVLTRPAVDAGGSLGCLPGTRQEKIDRYLKPLYDALYDMLPTEQVERRIASGEIEIAPIAFMRGRTLSDAFVILDEAQNTTPMQMKMFLTRFGMRSRMVICGDPNQTDLPSGTKSGLNDAVEKLDGIAKLSMIRFTAADVVRHPLVGKIVEAYEGPGA